MLSKFEGPKMVRTRKFNVDEALEGALNLFWRNGYEGTSLSELTAAMGLGRPSLYAAFGSKEGLFRSVLERYDSTCLEFTREALKEPTALGVVQQFLYGFADAQTNPPHPPGTLDTAAIACSAEAERIKQELINRRMASEGALTRRLELAKALGDMPDESRPSELARYVMTVVHGMAVQAASGASREALHHVVGMALAGWPFAAEKRRRRAVA
jgi:AcrR family transcriptional regulator